MVGAVQAWRKRDPEKAKPVWTALAEANLSVEKGLLHLKDAAQSEEAYKTTLQACSTSSADKVQEVISSSFAMVSRIFPTWQLQLHFLSRKHGDVLKLQSR